MTTNCRKTSTVLLGAILVSLSAIIHAGAPVWTLTPLTATSISVSTSGTATIQYRVTNQSVKSHSLVMSPITGITQMTSGAGLCSSPFTLPTKGSSCTLSLQVNGSQLINPITDGPIICQQGSTLQCYKPSPSNVLNITTSMSAYTVGGMVSGLSGSVVLQNNGTDTQTVSIDGAFTFSTAISEGSPYAVTVLTQPAGQTCTVTNASGTVGSSDVTNVDVNCSSNFATLTSSVSSLGLWVNGTARRITITNTGTAAATSVTYSATPALPSGTTIAPASCGTIAASGTCVLTITPDSTASATAYDTNPTPITLSISGTNTNTLTPTLNVLTYGSVYQGGYIYSVDDTTVNTGSIGGKVVTLEDQATYLQTGVVFSSNGANNTTASSDIIPGIAVTSTTATSAPTYADAQNYFNTTYGNEIIYPFPSSSDFSSCNGTTDGTCNSNNILKLYTTYITNYQIGPSPYTLSPGPTTPSYYAAGLCTATISSYSDWYLPAICEMGPAFNGTGCSVSTQNMANQLPDLLGSCAYSPNCLSSYYWSSTESSANPANNAWFQYFASGGGSAQYDYPKTDTVGVRCSRALTS